MTKRDREYIERHLELALIRLRELRDREYAAGRMVGKKADHLRLAASRCAEAIEYFEGAI